MKQPALQLLLLAASFAGSAAAQTSWPMFQGNPSHTGYLPVTIDPASLVPRFSVRVSTLSGLNPVTVADGKVFASSLYDSLSALDASTGALLWRETYPNIYSANPPSYADGKVYIQTCNSMGDTWLRCYQADTGQQVFQAPHAAQAYRYFAPTVWDHRVYVAGGVYGGMYSFDGDTGYQLWYTDLPQFDQWTPAVDADTAYGYVGNALYALARSNGVERYHIADLNFDVGSGMHLAPILGGQGDVLAVQGRRLLRFDLVHRRIAWELGQSYGGQPAVHDGVVYVNQTAALQARDQSTGALLWSWNQAGLAGNVIVTAGHLLLHSNTTTYLVDLQSHNLVWSTPHSGNITVGEGGIYIARVDGFLDCIGFAALPTATSLEPAQLDYDQPPATVTIRGTGFRLGTGMQVRFGNAVATDVVVSDDQTLTCRTPVRGPGIVDVTLENSIGHVTMPQAFAFTPAVALRGDRSPGTTAVVTFVQTAREVILAGYGFPPQAQVPVPPFSGWLQIPAPEVLFMTPFWPTAQLDLQLGIPPAPSLIGAHFLFQSLVGHGIYLGAGGAFSNAVELVIQ